MAWIRRRALALFVALSACAAVLVAGALALGERWTDPLLIGWAIAVETAALFAFCVIANALAGFIARPRRSRSRTIAETAVVAGCVGIQLAVIFHDEIWTTLAGHNLDATGSLIALTAGAGLLAATLTAAALLAARRPPTNRLGNKPAP